MMPCHTPEELAPVAFTAQQAVAVVLAVPTYYTPVELNKPDRLQAGLLRIASAANGTVSRGVARQSG